MLSPDFKTKEDQFNLLKLILTKQVYTADNIDIMNKCNFIVRSLNIYYGDPIDLINMQCILNLLNILTEGKIKVNTGNDDFDQIMITMIKVNTGNDDFRNSQCSSCYRQNIIGERK